MSRMTTFISLLMKTLDRSVETLGPESELFKLHPFYARVESNYV